MNKRNNALLASKTKSLLRRFLVSLVALLLVNCATETETAKDNFTDRSEKLSFKQCQFVFDKIKSFPNRTELALAIINNNSIIFFGVKRINDTLSETSNFNRVFEIGSISKVFTSTILANRVLENKVRLSTPIRQIVDYDIPLRKQISLIELANHTSGLPKQPENMSWFATNFDNPYQYYDEKKLIHYLSHQLEINPSSGNKYNYSNLGAGLLGYLLTKEANVTFEELIQKYIFSKYKMRNSTTDKEKIKTLLIDGLTPLGKTAPNWDFDILVGAGGIFSSVDDLSKFAQAQFNKENLDLALTRKSTFNINDTMSIGLAWHLPKLKNGNELIFHNGGTGGYSSSMVLDLTTKKGIIVLSNISAHHKQRGKVDELCFELLKSIKTK